VINGLLRSVYRHIPRASVLEDGLKFTEPMSPHKVGRSEAEWLNPDKHFSRQ
jgi:hypothetical protein